jgi:hypothetical protein
MIALIVYKGALLSVLLVSSSRNNLLSLAIAGLDINNCFCSSHLALISYPIQVHIPIQVQAPV